MSETDSDSDSDGVPELFEHEPRVRPITPPITTRPLHRSPIYDIEVLSTEQRETGTIQAIGRAIRYVAPRQLTPDEIFQGKLRDIAATILTHAQLIQVNERRVKELDHTAYWWRVIVSDRVKKLHASSNIPLQRRYWIQVIADGEREGVRAKNAIRDRKQESRTALSKIKGLEKDRDTLIAQSISLDGKTVHRRVSQR
jgi:hypothetical protein